MNTASSWIATGVILLAQVFIFVGGARAENQVLPTALLQFQERGKGVEGMGEKIGGLLFAELSASPEIVLVDRVDLNKVLEEQKISVSGLVKPDQAVRLGQLTGAKILVTGSVIEVDMNVYLVAKVIGTETSRTKGATIKGKLNDPLGPMVEELAKNIADVIAKQGGTLVPTEPSVADRIGAIKGAIGDRSRPKIQIKIAERHIGQATIDPAAETEFISIAKACGFEVVDGKGVAPDVLITGEGFSEFGSRHNDLLTVKGRLEVKATATASGNVLDADQQTVIVVDVSERIAGKTALQNAAADIAQRMLPKLAGP
ncbi:MAG: CsgG/HfaB family protein [Planctomycetota bacterium]